MKRIFISTDWDRLRDSVLPVAAPNRNNITKGIDLLGQTNSLLYFNSNTFTFSEVQINSEIILIYDEDYSNAINLIDTDKGTDLLLHHSRPNNPTPDYSIKFDHKVTGEHELTGRNYPDVFKIIFNDAITDKLSEILKVLGFTDKEVEEKETLESKLNLLHHCLTPEGCKSVTWGEDYKIEVKKMSEDGQELTEQLGLINDIKAKELFVKLKQTTDGPFGENYLSALRTLRDKLLVS